MPKIKFIYLDEYFYEVGVRPEPSQNFIPEWFRKMESYHGGKMTVRNRESNATAKKCTPMLDAISGGYTIPLWADVIVHQDGENGPQINWRTERPPFALHGPSAREIPPPPGYDNIVFKYAPFFRIETPPGYSIMVKPPAGHYDLPFQAIPATIESDGVKIDTNFPVWVKSGFEGIVEKGTPIAQVFPFKRENWTSEFSWIPWERHVMDKDKGFEATIKHNYVRNIWSRKSFK
mgnify:CR=1 FL=1